MILILAIWQITVLLSCMYVIDILYANNVDESTLILVIMIILTLSGMFIVDKYETEKYNKICLKYGYKIVNPKDGNIIWRHELKNGQ